MTRTRSTASLLLSLITLMLSLSALLTACQKANNTSYSITATFGPTNFQATSIPIPILKAPALSRSMPI